MAVSIECDLREHFGPVRDQGQRPTCMAFAASDGHAALRPAWVPLSCEFAYFQALKRDGGHPNDGTTAEAMLGGIRVDGQPPEGQWPYLNSVPSDLGTWKPPPTASPIYKRQSAFTAASIEAVVELLDQGVPLLLMMSLSDTFYLPNTDGVISGIEVPDPERRHAVIATGHGYYGPERVILIRNSWGASWGVNGYAWVSEQYLVPRINSTAQLKEDLSNVSGNTAKTDMRSSVA